MWRKPDFIIGGKDRPYMLRWYLLPRNAWFNVYLHCVLRDDDDRALHDHPWQSVSLVLAGVYREIRSNRSWACGPGSVIYRRAETCHRLEVVSGPVWTLFITGARVRNWGFHCPRGWVPWQKFVAADDKGNVGRGCGEMALAGEGKP